MDIFGNSIEEDPNLNAILSDTQNITATAGETTFTGDVNVSGVLTVGSVVPGDHNVLGAYHTASTGIISGGVLSLVGAPETSPLFNISAGEGIINDAANKIVYEVNWGNLTNLSTKYTGILTWVTIDRFGTVGYSSSEPTNAQDRQK